MRCLINKFKCSKFIFALGGEGKGWRRDTDPLIGSRFVPSRSNPGTVVPIVQYPVLLL